MLFILTAVSLILIANLAVMKLYCKLTMAYDTNNTCMVGKTVLITGANTGLGFGTAMEMAKRGARVILACRNKEKAIEAKTKIIEETGNTNVAIGIIDLSSLQSVRQFAKHINETEKRLDVLINNAGRLVCPKITEDGLDIIMEINYFSHFLLTVLLLELMKKSGPSRIINVSSKAGKYGKVNVKQLNKTRYHLDTYGDSKLCQILFTKELATRLKGTNVSVYSLHPGVHVTEIWGNVSIPEYLFLRTFSFFDYKTLQECYQTQNYVATAKGIENLSGRHFADCKVIEDYSVTNKPGLCIELWDKTVELLKLTKDELKILP